MRDGSKGGYSGNSTNNFSVTRRGRSAISAAHKSWCAKHSPGEVQSFHLERLEARQLLTGTWTTITNAVPASDGAQSAAVLSDGTIFVHGGAGAVSAKYYKLTPSDGSYVNGTWTTLASSSTARLFDATTVLTSGKVMVLGGEYSGTSTSVTNTNTGEIYDPVANSWTATANFPQTQFGEDPTEILPNGNVMAGYLSGAQTYIYNPSTNAWSATGTKLANDKSQQEAWVKLSDDSVLSYSTYSSMSSNSPSAQRYNPSSGAWTAAGTLPALLSTAATGDTLGPGLRLADGRVLFVGSTGPSAYYSPSTNTWAAGPTFTINSTSYVSADAPGAVLPNGDVLLALSPLGGLSNGSYNFPGPTMVVELNPTTNAYTNVTPSISGFSLTGASYATSFVVLPTGQVAMLNNSGKIAIYTESGSPIAGSAPAITNITNSAGSNTFTLTGYQLNGASEGTGSGIQTTVSSNYPIVQLTDSYGNITYARTFNWTFDGVSTLSSSVSFTEPVVGSYVVQVIANGIASPAMLDVQCGSAYTENIAVQIDQFNPAYVAVNSGINGSTLNYFLLSTFTGLIMTGDGGTDTLVDDVNLGGMPTTINGGNGTDDLDVETNGSGFVTEYSGSGTDYFDFSKYAENISQIPGFTYVLGGTGATEQIRMYDNNYSTGSTYIVTDAEVNKSGFGGLYYGVPVTGISLITGTGNDTVDVQSTYNGTPLFLNSSGGTDAVNIGYNGSCQSIDAAITVSNTPSFSVINIDDSSDTTGQTNIILNATGLTGTLTGLAPASINWTTTDISGITINGGSGGNGFYVTTAGIPYTTTINTGSGNDYVQFDNAISGSFTINGQGGTNNVDVIDNDATSAQSWLLTSTSLSRAGFSLVTSSLATLSLTTGSGNDTVDVESMPAAAVYISNGAGLDTYDVTTSAKVLFSTTYSLSFASTFGSATLTIDDSNSTSAYPAVKGTTFTVGSTVITYSGITTLTYNEPTVGGGVYFYGTNAATAYVINGGSGFSFLDLGLGNLSNLTSLVSIPEGGITFNAGLSSGSEVFVDDSIASSPLTYNFTTGALLIPGQLNVGWNAGITVVYLYAGSGTDTINVYSTAPGVPIQIGASNGNDNVTVGTQALGNAVANFFSSCQLGSLTIGNGGIVQVPVESSRVLLQVTSISAMGTGVLDLTNNDMIVHGLTLATVSALARTGFNAGGTPWTGAGITSSTAATNTSHLTAIGVIQNTYDGGAHVIYPTFDGATVSPTDVLVKYTYFGDADESGKVDATDYSRIDSAFLIDKVSPPAATGWYNGDFNYDGVINGSDYTLIDNSFNRQTASLAAVIADNVKSTAAKPKAITTLPLLNTPVAYTSNQNWQELQKKNKWATQFFDQI